MAILGKLRTREYNDQSGQRKWTTEILVNNLQLCGSTQEIQAAGMISSARQLSEAAQARPAAQPAPQAQAASPAVIDPPTDDLPF